MFGKSDEPCQLKKWFCKWHQLTAFGGFERISSYIQALISFETWQNCKASGKIRVWHYSNMLTSNGFEKSIIKRVKVNKTCVKLHAFLPLSQKIFAFMQFLLNVWKSLITLSTSSIHFAYLDTSFKIGIFKEFSTPSNHLPYF